MFDLVLLLPWIYINFVALLQADHYVFRIYLLEVLIGLLLMLTSSSREILLTYANDFHGQKRFQASHGPAL